VHSKKIEEYQICQRQFGSSELNNSHGSARSTLCFWPSSATPPEFGCSGVSHALLLSCSSTFLFNYTFLLRFRPTSSFNFNRSTIKTNPSPTGKGLSVTHSLYLKRCYNCQLTVLYRKLVKFGRKPPKLKRLLGLVQIQRLEAKGITRSE
jgi:hypothetical protein